MNEVQYERDQEMIAMGQHANAYLDAIFADDGCDPTLPALYRSIYKYTECGPWLSVQTWDGRCFHCQDLHKVDMHEVRYLLVGSIVEGSDAEVCADPIDLVECESPEAAVKLFNRTVEWVNDEACALWNEANAEDEDEDPEPPYAGYESEAELRRMAEIRRLEALRARGEA